MEQLKVEHTIWTDAPSQRAWQAITDPVELAWWLLPPALGMDMKRGDNGNLIEIFEVKEIK
jgi:hypothetical protein